MNAPHLRICQACHRELNEPGDAGWECDCGVVVCTDKDCIDEYFKSVANGEATRCRTCGLLM